MNLNHLHDSFFYWYPFAYLICLCNFWKDRKKYTILKKKIFFFWKISREFNLAVSLFWKISQEFNFADSRFQKISRKLNFADLGEIREISFPRKFLPLRYLPPPSLSQENNNTLPRDTSTTALVCIFFSILNSVMEGWKYVLLRFAIPTPICNLFAS